MSIFHSIFKNIFPWIKIKGGAIDGTPIGERTPANGDFLLLTGLTPPITQSADDTLTAAECKGQIVLVTGAHAQTLPTAAEGAGAGSLVTLRATTAAVFHAKAGSAENIILSGIALDNGDKTTSPGNAGDQITLWKSDASTWAEIGMIGGFVDGGA